MAGKKDRFWVVDLTTGDVRKPVEASVDTRPDLFSDSISTDARLIASKDFMSPRVQRLDDGRTFPKLKAASVVGLVDDSTAVVLGELSSPLLLWNIQTDKLVRELKDPSGDVYSLSSTSDAAVTGDGKQLAVGLGDGIALVPLRRRARAHAAVPLGKSQRPDYLAWSADGTRVAGMGLGRTGGWSSGTLGRVRSCSRRNWISAQSRARSLSLRR